MRPGLGCAVDQAQTADSRVSPVDGDAATAARRALRERVHSLNCAELTVRQWLWGLAAPCAQAASPGCAPWKSL